MENGSKDEMDPKEGDKVQYPWLCLFLSTETFRPYFFEACCPVSAQSPCR